MCVGAGGRGGAGKAWGDVSSWLCAIRFEVQFKFLLYWPEGFEILAGRLADLYRVCFHWIRPVSKDGAPLAFGGEYVAA